MRPRRADRASSSKLTSKGGGKLPDAPVGSGGIHPQMPHSSKPVKGSGFARSDVDTCRRVARWPECFSYSLLPGRKQTWLKEGRDFLSGKIASLKSRPEGVTGVFPSSGHRVGCPWCCLHQQVVIPDVGMGRSLALLCEGSKSHF